MFVEVVAGDRFRAGSGRLFLCVKMIVADTCAGVERRGWAGALGFSGHQHIDGEVVVHQDVCLGYAC